MKLFLDTANVKEIYEAANLGILDGVTTNPSLVVKEGRSFKEMLQEICKIVDGPISAEVVLEANPDVIGHINGGTTSMTPAEIDRLVATEMALEIVQCGNMRTALYTLRTAVDARATPRIIIGNDAPSGTGVIPLGILRTLSLLAGVGGLDPAQAIACATGNTARVYGLNRGVIAVGREADLVVCDAPIGSVGSDALGALAAGDLPGISMVLIDGAITIGRSRNTPPAARAAEVVKGAGPGGAGH